MIPQEIFDVMNKGAIYVYGRDKNHRPIYHMRCGEIKKLSSEELDLLSEGVLYLSWFME